MLTVSFYLRGARDGSLVLDLLSRLVVDDDYWGGLLAREFALVDYLLTMSRLFSLSSITMCICLLWRLLLLDCCSFWWTIEAIACPLELAAELAAVVVLKPTREEVYPFKWLWFVLIKVPLPFLGKISYCPAEVTDARLNNAVVWPFVVVDGFNWGWRLALL